MRARSSSHPRRQQLRFGSITTSIGILLGIVLLTGWLGHSLLGSVLQYLPGSFGREKPLKLLTTTAKLGPFVHTIIERGEIESSSNVEVRCEVRGRTSTGTNILEIVPEGSWVEVGDFLVRLDDSALQVQLIQQQIVCSNSESSVIEAQAKLDSAKLAEREYAEGTFKEKVAQQQSDLFVAEENMRRAEEYLSYSKRLAERGYVPQAQLDADAFAVDKARLELAAAKQKLKVLNEFTREKMLTELHAEIATGEAKLLARQRTWELDQAQLEEIETQIAKCVITAPVAGQVVYANNRSGRSSSGTILIEEGLPVRERQTIVMLPDPKKMRVIAHVHESRVGQVRPGLRAELKIDSMSDRNVVGQVTDVSEYPLPPINSYMSHVKEYAVGIEIQTPSKNIRPGMTAEVNILVERIDEAILVPVEAVMERDQQFFCAIAHPDGLIETREVIVGGANETSVMVLSGLESGQQVILNLGSEEVAERLHFPRQEDELVAVAG